MRYFICLSYNGAHFSGWQIQDNANSVQGEVLGGIAMVSFSMGNINVPAVLVTNPKETDAVETVKGDNNKVYMASGWAAGLVLAALNIKEHIIKCRYICCGICCYRCTTGIKFFLSNYRKGVHRFTEGRRRAI